MSLSMNPNEDIEVRQFSTQAIVYFAFKKESLNILLENGVMNLFQTFKLDADNYDKVEEDDNEASFFNQRHTL